MNYLLCCIFRYLCMNNEETGKQTLKDKASSFKFRLLSIHPSNGGFCILSHSLPPLRCHLETFGAHIQYHEKKKLKPRCLVYFLSQKHDRWKIGEIKQSRQQRQLWNLGEPTATNLSFTGVQWCTVGNRGGALLCFKRREGEWEKMAANEVGRLWSIVPSCSQ